MDKKTRFAHCFRMTTHFYEQLASFTDFSGFTDFSSYSKIPDDWIVLISDVIGSTVAIKEGRYKDVNMVGAASITCILNACDDVAVPFVFGGDGSTIVVPPALFDKTANALIALQAKSKDIFKLNLRIGAVSISDLRQKGVDVKVRKYELSKGNFLAMFAGGGLELADDLLKDPKKPNPYHLQPDPKIGEPDLDGLSCRWEPLSAANGIMLTMMVKAYGKSQTEETDQLSHIMGKIESIVGRVTGTAAPAKKQTMKYRWPPRSLIQEANIMGRKSTPNKSYLRKLGRVAFTSLVQLWCERFGKKAGNYDGANYSNEIRTNTDFRKFDGILRMVLDVTPDQASKIETYLQNEHDKQNLAFGIHTADKALMTCLVFSLNQSEHVHFIDGSNGGFALAAIGFKNQIKHLENTKSHT